MLVLARIVLLILGMMLVIQEITNIKLLAGILFIVIAFAPSGGQRK